MGEPKNDLENTFRTFMSILNTLNATLNEIQCHTIELRNRIDKLEEKVYGQKDDHS